VGGVIAALAITFMTFAFGIYGLFLGLGLFGAIAWATSSNRNC
jgi:hypothetical protein